MILYVGRGGVSGISINYEHQACQIRNLNIFCSQRNGKRNQQYLSRYFLDSAETDVVKNFGLFLSFFSLEYSLELRELCVSRNSKEYMWLDNPGMIILIGLLNSFITTDQCVYVIHRTTELDS